MADLGSYHRVERQADVAARGSRPAAPAQITLAPIVLIKGPEGLLVDRALDRLRRAAHGSRASSVRGNTQRFHARHAAHPSPAHA